MRKLLLAVSALCAPMFVGAQQATPPAEPPVVSGVIFANYQYRGDEAARSANKFDLERTYVNFLLPAGDRLSIRATVDVYQQQTTGSDAYYRGWTARFKFAYAQYQYLQYNGWKGHVRFGMVPDAFIVYEESFWPRWLSTTPLDKAGYYSTSDIGASTVVTLPNSWGEFQANVINGSSYTSRETDRFKDYQARLSITPLAKGSGLLKTLSLTGWTYLGTVGSQFANGGTGQVGPVGEGLNRARYGFFAGIKDPRMIAGVNFATRNDERETGANTTLSPRAVTDSTGNVLALYTHIKPFKFMNGDKGSPLGVVARWDRVKPNTDVDGTYSNVIAGLTYDLSKKVSLGLDYQETTPNNLPTFTGATKTYFLHLLAAF